MSTPTSYYENFPYTTVFFRSLINSFIFILGAVILAGFGKWVGIGYLAYCVVMLIWVMRFRCKYCVYYGKLCVAGFGKIAPIFFKKGAPADFPKYVKYVYPLLLTYLAPLLGGIVLLVLKFSVMRLSLVLGLVLIALVVNQRFMLKYGCVHCLQQADCPAYHIEHETAK